MAHNHGTNVIFADMKWIKLIEQRPPIDTDVIIWVGDDFQCVDIGRFDGAEWDTNNELSKYRRIEYWMEAPESPME
jgi:hypothetical protein